MSARRLALLDALGIDAWVPRHAAPAVVPATAPQADGAPARDWASLEAAVRDCRLCGLCETRTQAVFGNGDRNAQLMVIGEAPGADEDRQGEPFVGRAGMLLNAMLRAAGFARAEVFVANVLKCRPPNNRDPTPEESARCLPYLHAQVALVQPRVILCVGRIAAQRLLGTEAPLGRLRGKVHRVDGVPAVITYHPAYLLRAPAEKRKAWDDIRLALQELARGDGT